MTAIAILTLCMVLPGLSIKPYEYPRDAMLALCLPLAAAWWALYPPQIDEGLLILVTAWLCIIIVSTALSDRHDIAVKHAMRYFGAVAMGLVVTDGLTVLIIAGCVQAVFQLLCRRWPGVIDPSCPTPGGLCGNTNMSGAFLLPCFFAAIQTGDLLPAALIGAGIYATRCRGAIWGTLAGIPAFISLMGHWWLLIPAALGAGMFLPTFRRDIPLSLVYRIQFWRILPRLITWRILLVGMGPDCMRTVTAAMDDHHEGYALRWTRAHNDCLQLLFDGGLPMVAVYFSIVLYSILIAVGAGQFALAAGMVGMAVNGLVFHRIAQSDSMLAFWIMVGACG